MTKVLIYKNEKELAPVGGPRGYLYNLKTGLDQLNNKDIDFLHNKLPNQIVNNSKTRNILKNLFSHMPEFIKTIRFNQHTIASYKEQFECINNLPEDINQYNYIHFHSTFDMYKERDNLRNYKGKVIITSHSPKPLFQEYSDSCFQKIKNKKQYEEKLSQIDKYAFNNADYIVFPCKEAEEPYYNQWDEYKSIHDNNSLKYRYLLSGIEKSTAKISKEEIRKNYKIPSDAFLISYVGRHNEVKGYDLLKKIGNEALKNSKNIYFIIAGKEGPLYHLENEKWIEVGWTKDPHSIIAASDLFILPNRETYFDLVFLEVLSLGVPMLVSDTGGNKYFKKFQDSGIYFYSNLDTAINCIDNIYKMSKEELEKKGIKNEQIFDNNFNKQIFAENYINLVRSLDEE